MWRVLCKLRDGLISLAHVSNLAGIRRALQPSAAVRRANFANWRDPRSHDSCSAETRHHISTGGEKKQGESDARAAGGLVKLLGGRFLRRTSRKARSMTLVVRTFFPSAAGTAKKFNNSSRSRSTQATAYGRRSRQRCFPSRNARWPRPCDILRGATDGPIIRLDLLVESRNVLGAVFFP
jgi:hypothetical protein